LRTRCVRVDAVHPVHGDVHDHDVGAEFGHGLQRREPVLRLAHDVDALAGLEDAAQTLAQEAMVVDQHDAQTHEATSTRWSGAASVTRVPLPAADSMLISPPRCVRRSRIAESPRPRLPTTRGSKACRRPRPRCGSRRARARDTRAPACARVLGDVDQELAHGAEQEHADALGERAGVLRALERDLEPVRARHVLHEPLQRRLEAQVVQDGRRELEGHRARRLVGLVHEGDDVAHLAAHALVGVIEQTHEHQARERDRLVRPSCRSSASARRSRSREQELRHQRLDLRAAQCLDLVACAPQLVLDLLVAGHVLGDAGDAVDLPLCVADRERTVGIQRNAPVRAQEPVLDVDVPSAESVRNDCTMCSRSAGWMSYDQLRGSS
jgi:hypothetical protein